MIAIFIIRPYAENDAACGECLYEGFFTAPAEDCDKVLLWDYAQVLIEKCNFTLCGGNGGGAGRMRQATRELVKAYACGVESAALDDVSELLAWNQGIGYFSSGIGPSP